MTPEQSVSAPSHTSAWLGFTSMDSSSQSSQTSKPSPSLSMPG